MNSSFYIKKKFPFGKVLSQFTENFEMEDLVPEIFTIFNFLLFSGQMILAHLDNALDRQPNLCILTKQSAKQFHG